MKLILKWQSPVMEWDSTKGKEVPSKLDKESIFLSVAIKGLSENASYNFLDSLENLINEELEESYGKTSFLKCTAYEDEEEKTLYDVCGWKRDLGNVAEQKKEIMQTVKRICKELKKRSY